MNPRRKKNILTLLFIILAIHCGCEREEKGDPARDLLKRAREYWNLKVADDYVGTYEFMDPKSRSELTLAEYTSFVTMISYVKADVMDVALSPDGKKAKVHVELQYTSRHTSIEGMEAVPYTLHEPWLLVDNEWYRQWEKPIKLEIPSPN